MAVIETSFTASVDEFSWFSFVSQQVVAALMLGTRVAIGGTYNYAGKLYNRMFDAVVSGDLKTASECQQQSQCFIDVFLSHGEKAA